jgi:hypothetical protein
MLFRCALELSICCERRAELTVWSGGHTDMQTN